MDAKELKKFSSKLCDNLAMISKLSNESFNDINKLVEEFKDNIRKNATDENPTAGFDDDAYNLINRLGSVTFLLKDIINRDEQVNWNISQLNKEYGHIEEDE